MNKLVYVNNVNYIYNEDDKEKELHALKSISFEINKGDHITILGHNGSGKSTLGKHLNALLKPTNGVVYINQLNTMEEESVWEIRQTAGMVFQNPDNQIIATTVEEDIAFGPENLSLDQRTIIERVNDSLTSVNMNENKKKPPHLLSGGQKQRVAIAGVIAMKPSLIILDEATSMLDPIGRKEVLKTIKKLNKEDNITIIQITHFMEEAIDSDYIYVMENGKIVLKGAPKDIFKDLDLIKKLGLDVPLATEVANDLNLNGIKIRKDIINIEELVNELCQLKLKN